MTTAAGRRLTKLEGALAPREAVLAWLVEAQQFPSVIAHARSIASLPVEAAPLSVIGDRVEAAVRISMKGQPYEAVQEAIRRSVGDAAFLFSLVLQVNAQALDIARVEGLRAAAAFFWMGTPLGGPRFDDPAPAEAKVYVEELGEAWTLWRTVVDHLSLGIRVENEARVTLERRFLGGHQIFFADVGETWAGHVDLVQRLASLADLLAVPGRRGRAVGTKTGGSVAERAALRTTELADDARVRAHEIMGDRERAVAIMERRLLDD